MSVKNFKNYLKSQDEEWLRDELLTLYKAFEAVREYYIPQIDPESTCQLVEKYKKILERQFCPCSNNRDFPELNYSIARKAIRDFKKVNANPSLVIDLQLTYVEYGVECTLEYGDIDARFYDSMESMFRKTLKDMEKYELKDQFRKRCLVVQQNTADLGWGFGDAITELCDEYFLYEAPIS